MLRLEGLLRLLEVLCGEGRLQGLLLELEGGVWLLLLGLLREEGGGWLSEGWLGGRLLGGEELGVGGVSRVDEGVHSLAVSTGGNRGSARQARLLSLNWSRLELLSLNWSRLELLSLDWSRLELLSLSWSLLSWLSGSELSSVDVSLEIQVGGVGRVDERIEVGAGNLLLLLLLLWLLSYELWLRLSPLGRSDRSLLFPDGSSFRLWRR